jgi:MFS family permease
MKNEIANRLTKFTCAVLFAGACFLFYYGTAMLFLVPGYPGENYLKSLVEGRFLYGVVPFLSSIGIIAFAGWLWDRSHESHNLRRSIGRAFSFAIGAIILFWIGLIILADLRH